MSVHPSPPILLNRIADPLLGAVRSKAESFVRSAAQLVRASAVLRYAMILLYDAIASVTALYAAVALRFAGESPTEYVAQLKIAVPTIAAFRLVMIVGFGLHRWSFRMSGLSEAVRVGMSMLSASAVFMFVFQTFTSVGLPRSVYALDFFIALTLVSIVRFGPRLTESWYSDLCRKSNTSTARVLIVGAGSMGDLLARDLCRSHTSKYGVVGFVDDDESKTGMYVSGKPVLGTIAELPKLVARHRVETVLLAIGKLPAERVRAILQTCASSKVNFKKVPASYAYLDRRISAAMLHDLAPEDLLPRAEVAFDGAEIRKHVMGRRVLVTGAGGSIGGEICAQLAHYGAAQLVMLDMNENELYLRTRSLQEQYPSLSVHPEVADIRELSRLNRVAARYLPELVFHAAAHKHVPLMEEAPEEAVKNNVFGTLNVALMAHECGAERLVFISTDKAVNPSSVMGATKRIAELVIRDVSQRSSTKMTAVRFGNVLGSAGSAVPLFKQQIERGGPVTLTHPDCTRYFMTVSEAVGLVLLAGLGDYGELCVLDMGKPIRIVDLAMNLITLAGRIPEKEIPIVYTGLRKGEKLHEELLTDAEEETRQVRNRINVAKSPAPPRGFANALLELGDLAEEGDRDRVLAAIRQLVPTYQAPPALPLSMATGHDNGGRDSVPFARVKLVSSASCNEAIVTTG